MSYLITTAEPSKYNGRFKEFYLKYKEDLYAIKQTEDELILVEGFIYDMEADEELELDSLIQLLMERRTRGGVLPDRITGQYNIVFIKDNQIELINDFVGMLPLYYHFGTYDFITNNLYGLFEFGFQMDMTGFFQTMVPGNYLTLNNRTLVNDVKLLRNGEYLRMDRVSKVFDREIDSMQINNLKLSKGIEKRFIHLLKENAKIYSKVYGKVLLPITGGVDSRITLSSFEDTDSILRLISYGEPDYIDCKIANKLADHVKRPMLKVSVKDNLFPSRNEFDEMITNGGDYFVSAWFPVLKELRKIPESRDSVFLLGDVLNTLRATNVKYLRGRMDRVKYQLKRAIGKEIQLEDLDVEKYVEDQKQIYQTGIEKLKMTYPVFFEKTGFNEIKFFKETEADIEEYVDFIVKKFDPKKQENLEEAFYVCTWSGRGMAKQNLVFKGWCDAYVLMATRHVVKHNMNYSPLERFEDRLTHRMLRVKGYNHYSHLPTAQIPFVGYNRNIYLKYALWAFRSGVDQILIKLGKKRLVNHIEWFQYYKNDKNRKLLVDLLDEVPEELKIIPIDIFNKRATGELWPLAEVDINAYIHILKVQQLAK